MKKLMVLMILFLVGCNKPPLEKPKDLTLTQKDIELARCVCKKYSLILDQIVPNPNRFDFSCFDKKKKRTHHLYFYPDTFIEGCTK